MYGLAFAYMELGDMGPDQKHLALRYSQLLVRRSVRPSVNCGVSVVETSLATGYNQTATDYHHRDQRAHGGLTEDSIILSCKGKFR